MANDENTNGDDSDGDGGDGRSVWRYARASRAHVIIDADGYFQLIREAMANARQQIFLIGWDFDTRIALHRGGRRWKTASGESFPSRLGAFVSALARRRPKLEIRILKWNFALAKSLVRGTMAFDLLRWWRQRGIDFKFDAAHPVGTSHHQKIVVIDDKLAVCGGIDMTSDRWDTREHLDDDPRRRQPGGKFYAPWHDVTMMMEGDVARVLAELGRRRWEVAGGIPVPECREQTDTPWPERLVAEFEDVEIGIARTRAAYGDVGQLAEIEALFVEQIARARKFIYAETQYFAARRIAEAIAARLDEPDPPEIVIINPHSADGWLEQQAMDSARELLVRAVGARDHAGRFRIYCPYTAGGTPIYVHAKLTIVDDQILRIGSANMNNRSMGLDSECDVFLDAARPGNGHIVPAITRLRLSLLAEHCGMDEAEVAERLGPDGSMIAFIDAASRKGRHLAPLALNGLNGAQDAIAEKAILDPERPEEMFEPIAKGGLFRGRGRLLRPSGGMRA